MQAISETTTRPGKPTATTPTAVRLRARVPSLRPARAAAERLARELEQLGMPAVVNGDGAVALVSVWRGLWVCCLFLDGRLWYRWWNGRISTADRPVYAFHDPNDPRTAARRIARRFFEVWAQYPDADVAAGPDSAERWHR